MEFQFKYRNSNGDFFTTGNISVAAKRCWFFGYFLINNEENLNGKRQSLMEYERHSFIHSFGYNVWY